MYKQTILLVRKMYLIIKLTLFYFMNIHGEFKVIADKAILIQYQTIIQVFL